MWEENGTATTRCVSPLFDDAVKPVADSRFCNRRMNEVAIPFRLSFTQSTLSVLANYGPFFQYTISCECHAHCCKPRFLPETALLRAFCLSSERTRLVPRPRGPECCTTVSPPPLNKDCQHSSMSSVKRYQRKQAKVSTHGPHRKLEPPLD